MKDLHTEEKAASLRVHLLYMYGRMAQLDPFGVCYGVTGLTEKGTRQFQALLETGFQPNRDRLVDCVLLHGVVRPKFVDVVVDMMLDYDYLMEEMRKNHEEGY